MGVATTPPVATAATATPLFVAAVIDQPILAVVYAITVGISVWLFRDARRRGRSVVVATGWAVGGVVLPGIVHFGLSLYPWRRGRVTGAISRQIAFIERGSIGGGC